MLFTYHMDLIAVTQKFSESIFRWAIAQPLINALTVHVGTGPDLSGLANK